MKSKIIIIGLVVATMFVTSCKKIKEEIVGVWYYQTYKNTPNDQVVCNFLATGEMIRTLQKNEKIYCDTCQYSVVQTAFKKQVIITNSKDFPEIGSFDGTYKVYNYKDDILKMNRISFSDGTKGGSFKRIEMIRKK